MSNLIEQQKADLAAAFRWAARLNFHEAVANHFSLAVNDDGTRFIMNPNQRHFSLIKASDIIELDANDPESLTGPDAPDVTAWGLHGGIHRHCPHARCVMHVHSNYATVLASLADSNLPPIDQNAAMFYDRYVIDENYGGLALEEEGSRCAQLLADPKHKVMISRCSGDWKHHRGDLQPAVLFRASRRKLHSGVTDWKAASRTR